MKLHSNPRSGRYTVTAHGAGFVAVNGEKFTRSLLLEPGRLDPAWGPERFDALAAEHVAALADVACDVLLLGTGAYQRFPAPALLRPLYETGRGVEVMDTAAACRTYTILVAEGRAVAAALIIE